MKRSNSSVFALVFGAAVSTLACSPLLHARMPIVAPTDTIAGLDSLATRLDGTWSVQLELTEPNRFDSPRRGQQGLGQITLSARRPSALSSRLSYVPLDGTLRADLSAILGSLPPYDVVGGAGRLRDSVELDLGSCQRLDAHGLMSCVDHGGIKLWGRLRGDSITGTWEQALFVPGSRGTFVLRRVKPSSSSGQPPQ